jgi:hypothetical protein
MFGCMKESANSEGSLDVEKPEWIRDLYASVSSNDEEPFIQAYKAKVRSKT